MQNNSSLFSNFILNLYIVYELNNWSCNPTNSFTLENSLFVKVKLPRNADKSKFTYNGQGIGFDVKVIWSFGNGFARSNIIFGVNNTSSSHTDNKKKTF